MVSNNVEKHPFTKDTTLSDAVTAIPRRGLDRGVDEPAPVHSGMSAASKAAAGIGGLPHPLSTSVPGDRVATDFSNSEGVPKVRGLAPVSDAFAQYPHFGHEDHRKAQAAAVLGGGRMKIKGC